MPPNLVVDIGSGQHPNSLKPRRLILKTEKNCFDEPVVKLLQNRDDDTCDFEKCNTLSLDMTMWSRMCFNDHCFSHFANKLKFYLTEDASFHLGKGIYEYQTGDMLHIRQKHLPVNCRQSVDWQNVENRHKLEDFLVDTHVGVSLNSQEYKMLRVYFDYDVMCRYIRNISSFTPECMYCHNTTIQRYRNCRYCNYFLYNLKFDV